MEGEATQVHAPAALAAGMPPADSDAAAIATLAEIVRHEAGLEIGANRHAMIRSRLSKRLRALRLASITDYLDYLQAAPSQEMPHLISCLTTNVSSFFREPHHFALLTEAARTHLAPQLARRQRVRLWSAGCALGQEPWSIAMVLAELGIGPAQGDVRILATDVDPEALRSATAGIYPASMLSGLSEERRSRHMVSDGSDGGWTIGPGLRALVTFRELNLIRPFPMRGPFDVVFCRNVMIYFDEATQIDLCRRLAAVLSEGGLLCIGHSERLADSLSPLFASVGLTAYRRTAVPVGSETHQSGRKPHGAA